MTSSSTQRSNPSVAVFDSGLGGLTILDAIARHFPAAHLCYCSDNEAFPYGSKSEAELLGRVGRVLSQLNTVATPDILVIACNTASTVALPKIRSLISQPVVGVVPAIKPAAAVSCSSHIALLATPATVQRAYTQQLIDQFGATHQWVKLGSTELVQIAEHKMYGKPPNMKQLADILSPLSTYTPQQMDTVVLGCTHFPLLSNELKQLLPHIKFWIDSSDAIANRVGFWLHELGLYGNLESRHKIPHTAYFTRMPDASEDLNQALATRNFLPIRHLQIE